MTYRRKTDAQIQRIRQALEKEGRSPATPLWLSIGSASLIFVFISHFPIKFNAPLGFSRTSLMIALASGLGIFIFLYAMQLVVRRNLAGEPRARICGKCFKTEEEGGARCPCGGTYEPMDYYDKIEDK